MFNFTVTPPLSLYIHIPWCVRKCPYCDFNSHEAPSGIPQQAYVSALLADLEQELPAVWGRPVESIFIGGGTPSLFKPEAIEQLLSGVRSRVQLKPGAEITLEANPGTVDREHFEGFRAAGINRLSIGVQSFKDDLLEGIGRIHSGREAIRAAEAAHDAGFDNFNLDLMFGLPGQAQPQALDDLRTAIDLEPAHLSWYELTIEPNTWFYRHPPQLPDDTALWDMQLAGRTLLEQNGYARYEVSAWSQPGRQCRHNLNYWQFGDYLGIGAGAHGKITNAATQKINRRTKIRHPKQYLDAKAFASSCKELTANDVTLEFVMNALRLDAGFSTALFTATTGLPVTTIEDTATAAMNAGLLVSKDNSLRASELGQRYLNELLQYWLPETSDNAQVR
ncbi:MAG: radical SAM family heme chaperone HemW [Gammaproteobacteria bacterium]|nr:radical SAM family heme chaperone HemW [Gammaproteobacteria bacterium]